MLYHTRSPWLRVKGWLLIDLVMCNGRQEIVVVQACLMYELFVLAGLQHLKRLLQDARQNGGVKKSRALWASSSSPSSSSSSSPSSSPSFSSSFWSSGLCRLLQDELDLLHMPMTVQGFAVDYIAVVALLVESSFCTYYLCFLKLKAKNGTLSNWSHPYDRCSTQQN